MLNLKQKQSRDIDSITIHDARVVVESLKKEISSLSPNPLYWGRDISD